MKLSRINTVLLAAIVAINLYVIALPLAPAVVFWARSRGDAVQKLTQQIKPSKDSTSVAAIPGGNRLIIPRLLLNEPIQESNGVLNSGIWRRTKTSTPDHGGNTVIVGHRFTYTNPLGSFYNLDKMRAGDEIGVFWYGQRYIYKVTVSRVVPPTESQVEAPTKSAQLTLYTCTPLYLPKDRLVVVAEQEKN